MSKPTPLDGCFFCGVPKHKHFQRWHRGAGWHAWIAPADWQIRARAQKLGGAK